MRVMLEESVRERLAAHYEQLKQDGSLPGRERFQEYFNTFRRKFGPEKLASVDGVALLELMHAHGNRESLVYWLEFKNDDEFPSPLFGSIAGGSAFKFGIFRRRETGNWVAAGEAKSGRDVTVDEAVAIARKHRDQLIAGCKVFDEFKSDGDDDDYLRLQTQLAEVAPAVHDLAWGHKYFYLLYPDKIDDFHNVDWQRFYIIKMLQTPPQTPGRYVCAGRFVSSAKELGIGVTTLVEVAYSLFGTKHRYWRIGTSTTGGRRNRWPMMKDNSFVAVGWDKVGDVLDQAQGKGATERFKEILGETFPEMSPQTLGRQARQLLRFLRDVSVNDIVVAMDGKTVLGIGRVTGPAYYQEDAETFRFRHAVDWLSFDEWQFPETEGLLTTVHELNKKPANLLEVERRIRNAPPIPPLPRPIIGPGPPVLKLDGIPGRIQSVLERKSQVILYGPPGTGKTWWAEKTACELASLAMFRRPFPQLGDTEKSQVLGSEQQRGRVRLCCFHPAYGYEDFLEGYRPSTNNGQISFSLRNGIFKQLCEDARAESGPFYLIVDEINRGDIPRIFGELLTVLETDKRRKPITLPMSGEVFHVPENVFLIGTMNTADRSISLLDAALRRRFGFIELMPDSSLLRDTVVGGVPLRQWFEALNRRICQHVGRDARNLQIGHSYLLQREQPLKDLSAFKRALRDDIIPLVEEYCYEDAAALRNILGEGLVHPEEHRIREELFADGHEQDLIQALLQPCPEIATSTEAVTSDEPEEEEESDDEEGGEAP
ncbi:MAG: AAA family ATPase [Pirellulaceae bacterium]